MVQRIELVGRQEPRQDVEDEVGRRVLEPVVVRQPVEERGLQRAEQRRVRDAAPEIAQRGLRTVAPADGHAVGHDGGVHGAGARRADALELDRLLLEQAVEHAPGEGAVRAAALEGEVDGPDPARERPGFESRDIDVLVHGVLPFSARSSRRRPAAPSR